MWMVFFQVVLIGIEDSDQLMQLNDVEFLFNWNYVLKKYKPYTFFWFDGYFVLIVNNLDPDSLEKITDKMYKRTKKRMPSRFIHLGIGTPMTDFRQVILSYNELELQLQWQNNLNIR